MLKIDMHTHTSGVSFCSEVSPRRYAELFAASDVDGAVLTNHYSRMYMFRYGRTWDEQVRVYLEEYRAAEAACVKAGVRLFLGAEVAISTPQSDYVEFLLYGPTESFFLSAGPLYDMTQKQLYQLCHDHNVLLFQSHPFRSEHGHFPQDPEYLDGTEINCHPQFLRRKQETLEWADRHGLAVVCGSDFHYPVQAGSACTLLPSDRPIVDFLAHNKRPDIRYR